MWKGLPTIVAIAALAVGGDGFLARNVQAFELITAEEARSLRVDDETLVTTRRLRSLPRGPLIMVKFPTIARGAGLPTVQTSCPCALLVAFERNQAPVDMQTLKIIARKGIFSKSLTQRLMPFVRGTTLDVKEVEIPRGKFKIEIAIADMRGNETVQSYLFVVSG